MKDEAVEREHIDAENLRQEIDEVFTFNAPATEEQEISCRIIQEACKALSLKILERVPEGKEQTIAINTLLSTALWARHGITRRQVTIVALPPDGLDVSI